MINPFKTTVRILKMDPQTRIIDYEIINTLSDTNIMDNKIYSKYIPTKGDRLWFYPGCDVPRFKIKQFCQLNDVAVVKYKDKSSVRFLSPNVLENMITASWKRHIPKNDFITWLDSVMCNSYEQLKKDILSVENDLVYMEYPPSNSFSNEELFGNKKLPSNIFDTQFQLIKVKEDSFYQHIIDMVNDPNLKHQDDMLSLLNTGTIMDETMYNDIQRLLKSSDIENTKVAMESMANCDFQKSALYLLLLMKDYGTTLYNSGNRHHVNFKSLLKYFQIGNINSISLDQIINSLKHQKLLNLTNLNALMPLALEEIKETGDMENIKVIDVGLTPEMEQAIAENILDQPEPVMSLPQGTDITFAPTLDTAPGAFT